MPGWGGREGRGGGRRERRFCCRPARRAGAGSGRRLFVSPRAPARQIRTAQLGRRASLQAALRGHRRASPSAESRKRWSNLVERWQWQSAGPSQILTCRKVPGGAMASVCHRVTHMSTSPVASNRGRGACAWGRRCLCGAAAL